MLSSRYNYLLIGLYYVAVGAGFAVMSWLELQLAMGVRVWNTVLAFANTSFVFLAWNWNALSFRLNY